MEQTYDVAVGYPTVLTGRKIVYLLSIYLRPFDITPEQWTVLRYLGEQDGISQKELSSKSEKDQGTLARILDNMDRKHWIERKTNNKDRRSFLVFLTPEGRHLKEQLEPGIEKLFQQVFAGVTAETLDCFLNCLEQLKSNIEGLVNHKKDKEMKVEGESG